MNLYETDIVNATKNPFIKSLFQYRITRSKIQQLTDDDTSEVDNNEIVQLCMNASIDYEKAINRYAIQIASSNDVNKHQKDFKDWLLWNKTIILGVFFDLRDICETYNENERAKSILDMAWRCLEGIEHLETKDRNTKDINLLDIHAKYNELCRAKNAVIKKNWNNILRRHYAQRFFDFLKTLLKSEFLEHFCKNKSANNHQLLVCLLEEIEKGYTKELSIRVEIILKDCDEQTKEIFPIFKGIVEHYETLSLLLTNGTSKENNEFLCEWKNFQQVTILIKNEEIRKSLLTEQVEKSIELCYVWESKNILEKVQLQFENLLKVINKKWNESISNLKPIKNRLMEFIASSFGVIFWPLLAPTLAITSYLSGTNCLKRYHGFLAEQWKNAYEFACAKPHVALAVALGVLCGGAILLLTPAASIGCGVAISAHNLIAYGLGAYAISHYVHNAEIQRIENKHEQDLQNLRLQKSKHIYDEENDCKTKISINRNIVKCERDEDKLKDIEEILALRSKQLSERSKQGNQKKDTKKKDAKKVCENNIENETRKAQQLFKDATLSDLQDAQNEYEYSLKEVSLQLQLFTEKQNNIINEIKLFDNSLQQLNDKQTQIFKSLNSSHCQVIVVDPDTHIAEIYIRKLSS